MKIITKILDYIIVNEEVSNFEVIYGGFNELIISFIYTENKEFKNTVRFAYVDVLNYITENKNDWFKYVVKSFFNIFIIVKCDDENKSEVKKRLSFAYKLFFLEIDKNLTYITSKQKNVIMNELISKRDNIINIIGFKEYIKEVIGFYFIENRDLSNISSLITLELILEDLKDFEEFNTVIDILSFSRIKNIRHINIILTIVFSVMYEKFSESQLDVLSKEIEITKVFNLKIVNLNHKSFFENILVSDKFKEYEDLVTDYLFLLNRDAGNYIDFTNELENYIKEYDGKQYKQMYSNLSEIFKISLHLNQTKYEDLVLNSFYHLTKKLLLSLSYKELNIERNDIFKQSIKNYEEIFYNLRQEENKSYLIELILRNRNSEISQEKKDYYDLLIRLSYRSIESGEHKVIRACSNCMGWYLFEELSSVSMRTPLNDLKRMLKETKAFYEHVFNMKNVETTLFVGTVFIINFIKASFKKDNAEKLKREINQVLIKLDIHHLEHLVQSAEIRKKFVYEMFEDKSKSDVDKYTESYIKYLNNQISQKHRQRKK